MSDHRIPPLRPRPQHVALVPPAEPAVPLSGITITTPTGREFAGDDIADLLGLASRHPGTLSVTDAGDVNMKLRGLATLCAHASHDGSSYEDDKHMLWFIADALGDLAARLENDGAAKRVAEYTVTVTPMVS